MNPNCCDQKDCSLQGAVAGVIVRAPIFRHEDPNGVGAPISCVTLWGVSTGDFVAEANMTSVVALESLVEPDFGAGVFFSVGGGINIVSASLDSLMVDPGDALDALRDTSAKDLKQLFNSLSLEDSKNLVLVALPEMGEILSRLMRESPMEAFMMAASFPIRKCNFSLLPLKLGVFMNDSCSSAKSILFKLESSPGDMPDIMSLEKGVANVSWRLDIGVIPCTFISLGLIIFNPRSPPKEPPGELKTDLRALEKQFAVKSMFRKELFALPGVTSMLLTLYGDMLLPLSGADFMGMDDGCHGEYPNGLFLSFPMTPMGMGGLIPGWPMP